MLREYTPKDFDAIIDVWLKASKLVHPFLSLEFLDQEVMNIKEIYIPNSETWVYEHNGSVIGFISIVSDEIGAIFLHPQHHGKGYGKAMMDKAVSLKGTLEVDIFKENTLGADFHFRYGFTLVKEYTHWDTGNQLLRLAYTPE